MGERGKRVGGLGDDVLERVARLLGVNVEAARRVAPQVQKLLEAAVASAATFAQRFR